MLIVVLVNTSPFLVEVWFICSELDECLGELSKSERRH